MAGEREEVAKDGGGEQKLEQTMPSEPYYHIFGYLKNQKKTVTTGPSKWNIWNHQCKWCATWTLESNELTQLGELRNSQRYSFLWSNLNECFVWAGKVKKIWVFGQVACVSELDRGKWWTLHSTSWMESLRYSEGSFVTRVGVGRGSGKSRRKPVRQFWVLFPLPLLGAASLEE